MKRLTLPISPKGARHRFYAIAEWLHSRLQKMERRGPCRAQARAGAVLKIPSHTRIGAGSVLLQRCLRGQQGAFGNCGACRLPYATKDSEGET
jgi:hypothetical protein